MTPELTHIFTFRHRALANWPFVITLSVLLCCSPQLLATSKRIEVYTISQHYWDVKPGDSLSAILYQLVPGRSSQHKQLSREILALNPRAFINGDPNRLKANIRLWLPNAARPVNRHKQGYYTQSFSWGEIHRPRRD